MQSSHLTVPHRSLIEESPGIGWGRRLSRPKCSHGEYSRRFPLSNVKKPARKSTRRAAKSQAVAWLLRRPVRNHVEFWHFDWADFLESSLQ